VTDVDRRAALFDGTLAGALLAVVVGAAVATGARFEPPWILAGAVATLFAEAIAGRHERPVRRAWSRPTVKAGSLCLALGGVAVGLVLAPSPALSAAAGALASYLLLVALVAGGAVPPPRAWT
jgi:hypothetical protein